MGRERQDLRERTYQFALRVVRVVESVRRDHRRNYTADVLARQLLRAGTSVGANYRAACRARSNAEFIAKMGIVEEEADETQYWIELLVEAGLVRMERVRDLLDETDELIAIMVTSIRTARKKK